MERKTYRVLRDHIGGDGTLYSPHGENSTRAALPHEVAHLIPQTLVEIDADAEAARAAAEAEAKAEEERAEAARAAAEAEAAKAPENKADKPAKEVKGA